MTDIQTAVNTVDIEVATDDGFPEYENPSQEITAITAHDSISNAYWTGVLSHEGWGKEVRNRVAAISEGDETPDQLQVTVYSDERQLLHDYWRWVDSTDPSFMSGFNSHGFDYPYLINRSLRLSVDAVHDVSISDDDEGWIYDAPRATKWAFEGVPVWDTQQALIEVEVGQRDSNSLDAIARDVLGWGKDEMGDFDDAYRNDPVAFVRYNIRDVEATVGIREEKELVDDYDAFQQLSGSRYPKSYYPRNMIDNSLIRRESNPMEVKHE